MSVEKLPAGWNCVRLDEIAEVRSGLAKGRATLREPVDLPYLSVANVQDGRLELANIKSIQVEAAKVSRYALKPGDVLFTEGGDHDKLGRGTVWQGQIETCLHQNHVFAVRVNPDRLDPWFLSGLASSLYGKRYFLNAAKRTTNLASINSSQLKAFPVLLPPLPEQRKIAAILSSVDETIEKTEAVIAQLQVVKKAMMQALLTRGLPGRHTRFKKTELGDIPEEWELRPLHTVAQVQTGIAKGKKADGDAMEVSYLRVANVQDGFLDLRDIKTLSVDARALERYALQKGDVLFTEGGDADKLGRGCVWHAPIEPCLHQNHVFAARPNRTQLIPEFLSYFGGSPAGKRYFLDCAKQTTNLASINSTQLKSLPVPIPSLDEQQGITEAIHAVERRMETERHLAEGVRSVKNALMSALLTGQIRVTPGEATS